MEKMSEEQAQELDEEIMPHVEAIVEKIEEEDIESQHDMNHYVHAVLVNLANGLAMETDMCLHSLASAYDTAATKISSNSLAQIAHQENQQNKDLGYIG